MKLRDELHNARLEREQRRARTEPRVLPGVGRGVSD